MTRLSARMGVALNTMIDSTTSHIAEMMIQGSNMGITDMTKLLNDHTAHGTAKKAAELAREVIAFEEENLERLKKYL
jgi:translation initiation factor 2B subunit (eIF-2B alpha/beta/delta family)